MKQINLIPNELAVSPKYVRVAKEINKVSVFGMSVFAFFLTLFLVFFYYYSSVLKKTNADVVKLKANIASLEDSEQHLILAKDRLAKISAVKKLNFTDTEIVKVKAVLDELNKVEPQDETSVALSNQKVEVNFKVKSSDNLANALRLVGSLGLYKSIFIPNISSNADFGYNVNMDLNNE